MLKLNITKLSIVLLLAKIFLILPTFAGTVKVKVNNIKKKCEMHLAIYDDADVFENDNGEKGGAAQGIIQGVIEDVKIGSVTYTFELPDGTYAIGIFVDKNYNNKMDRNLFGVPKEQFGFSNNAKGNFGPPSFEDASFTVLGDMKIEINL